MLIINLRRFKVFYETSELVWWWIWSFGHQSSKPIAGTGGENLNSS